MQLHSKLLNTLFRIMFFTCFPAQVSPTYQTTFPEPPTCPTCQTCPECESPTCPETEPSPTCPETDPSPTCPETEPSPTCPETEPSPTCPETEPSPTCPETEPSPTCPETEPSPTCPETEPSPTCPETEPSPTCPETEPSPTCPETEPSPTCPETEPSPTCPETEPSPTCPETEPSPTCPETEPSPTCPETEPSHTCPELPASSPCSKQLCPNSPTCPECAIPTSTDDPTWPKSNTSSECPNSSALVSVTIVSLLLIISLGTSTALLTLYLLRLRKQYSSSKDCKIDKKKSVTCSASEVESRIESTAPERNIISMIKSLKDRKSDAKQSNKNPALGSGKIVNCKRNAAYDCVTKVPTVKSHSGTTKNKATSSSLSGVVCKENEAYGGVAAGYKVIREVVLSLQEMSDSSSVCVSSNQAYKLSKTATREDSRE